MGQKSRSKKKQANQQQQMVLGAGGGFVAAAVIFLMMGGFGSSSKSDSTQGVGPIVRQESPTPAPPADNSTNRAVGRAPAPIASRSVPPATNSGIAASSSEPASPADASVQATANPSAPPAQSVASVDPGRNPGSNLNSGPGMTAETSPAAGTPGPLTEAEMAALGTPAPNDSTSPTDSTESAEGQVASQGALRQGAPIPADEELKLPDLIERVEPAVVRINTRSSEGSSVGSGYVVSTEGIVVTNYHVIEGAKELTVEFADGTRSEVLGFRHYDTSLDIAIIQIAVPDKGLTAVPVASALPKKGETVVAFGAPLGLSFTTTQGIISAIRNEEEIQGMLNADLKGTWLQTSTPISPGNSGGPLVDMFGSVIAMNTMQISSGQNLNFAISAPDVIRMLEEAESKPLQGIQPDNLKPIDRSLKRQMARNIEGTERGMELLAKVDEIFLILLYKSSNIDPQGAMRDIVYNHAEQAIKRSNIDLSFGEPSGDAAIMLVSLDMRFVRNAAPGTQEVVIDAVLIVEDPLDRSQNKLVKIWHAEETSVGTVALQAIAAGRIPPRVGTEISRTFTKFRAARSRAERAVK